MKAVYVDTLARPHVSELDNAAVILKQIDCSSNVLAGSAQILPEGYETIFVCRRVDASNFCLQIPLSETSMLKTVEILADGGSITIFPTTGGGMAATFLDGSSDISTTTGVRLRQVFSPSAPFNMAWAIIG
jgi:hypothetical protein